MPKPLFKEKESDSCVGQQIHQLLSLILQKL